MSLEDKNTLWERFIKENFVTKPRLSNLFLKSQVIDLGKGSEIRIPIDNQGIEDWLNDHLSGFLSTLNSPNSDYSVLLPVSFSYIRKDGTVVKAVTKQQKLIEQKEPQQLAKELADWGMLSKVSRNGFPIENTKYFTAIVQLLNSVNPPEAVAKCKNAFMMILEERRNASLAEQSFESADNFLSAVKEPLKKIERELGKESDYYKQASNLVVQSYLNRLIEIIQDEETVENLKKASERTKKLYDYSISESTKSRVLQASVKFVEIEQAKTPKPQGDYNSKGELRPSVKILRVAERMTYINSGGKRLTSPALGWIAFPVYIVGWIVSLFDKK